MAQWWQHAEPAKDPRYYPAPVPSAGVFDSPLVYIALNYQWLAHLDGLIGRLLYEDAWLGTQEEVDFAVQEVNKLLAGLQAETPSMTYPQQATMWHHEARPAAPGTITGASAATLINGDGDQQWFDVFAENTNIADGASFKQSFVLASGLYIFAAHGIASNRSGILDWYLDDTLLIAGQDWYVSDDFLLNYVQFGEVNVPTDGLHILEGRTNGKNADSTDYAIILTKYWFVPPIYP